MVGLVKELCKVGNIYPLIVAVLPDVPTEHRKILSDQGCILWEFDKYSKMIYLDVDIQLYDNIDHLFDLPDIHFYAVTEASTVGGYDVPADALINFTVWEMGNNPQVWENPDEFRPDRFLYNGSNNDSF
ncbi:hypothetical protein SUGI_0332670 [Cryptomeria japonica]|nr:hypothetical protein SUGI_0332670 [Cryptomeria japonica]